MSLEELVEKLNSARGGQTKGAIRRDILVALIESYPPNTPISRNEIARLLGINPDGTDIYTFLKRMRDTGVIAQKSIKDNPGYFEFKVLDSSVAPVEPTRKPVKEVSPKEKVEVPEVQEIEVKPKKSFTFEELEEMAIRHQFYNSAPSLISFMMELRDEYERE